MDLHIGLDKQKRKKSCDILKVILANAFTLYTKTLNYHWNIISPDFPQLHKLFQEQYESLQGNIDRIAERIRSLGERTPGSQAEFLKLTTLKENTQLLSDQEMIDDLLRDHERICAEIRHALEVIDAADGGTSNMLEELLELEEHHAWMLRSIRPLKK